MQWENYGQGENWRTVLTLKFFFFIVCSNGFFFLALNFHCVDFGWNLCKDVDAEGYGVI